MKRGEVWWWHEPGSKARPVCILTRDEAIPILTKLVVAPATTRRRGVDAEVPLDTDDELPKPCVLSLDGLTVARKRYLSDRITTLSPDRMHQVCRALALATGC